VRAGWFSCVQPGFVASALRTTIGESAVEGGCRL
jgi:hypothetical protein